MKKEIIDLISKKIQKCNEFCFCNSSHEKKDLLTDQKKCGNCHSKDILIELLKEVNNLELQEQESAPCLKQESKE